MISIEFWNKRNEREKRVLTFAAIFVISSFLYAFVWQPGEKSIKRLNAELPAMRMKIVTMRSEATEIAKLKKNAPGRQGDMKSAFEASARSANIGLSRIAAGPDGKISAEFASTSFDAWSSWLEKLRVENHIRLESAQIRKLDDKGTVKIAALFGGMS